MPCCVTLARPCHMRAAAAMRLNGDAGGLHGMLNITLLQMEPGFQAQTYMHAR